jgi:hypothetical protein
MRVKKMRIPITTALAIVVFFDAFAWLVGTIPTLSYAFSQGHLPTFGGIRLMGGPFDKLGLEALIVAGIGYIIVSGLKILAG